MWRWPCSVALARLSYVLLWRAGFRPRRRRRLPSRRSSPPPARPRRPALGMWVWRPAAWMRSPRTWAQRPGRARRARRHGRAGRVRRPAGALRSRLDPARRVLPYLHDLGRRWAARRGQRRPRALRLGAAARPAARTGARLGSGERAARRARLRARRAARPLADRVRARAAPARLAHHLLGAGHPASDGRRNRRGARPRTSSCVVAIATPLDESARRWPCSLRSARWRSPAARSATSSPTASGRAGWAAIRCPRRSDLRWRSRGDRTPRASCGGVKWLRRRRPGRPGHQRERQGHAPGADLRREPGRRERQRRRGARVVGEPAARELADRPARRAAARGRRASASGGCSTPICRSAALACSPPSTPSAIQSSARCEVRVQVHRGRRARSRRWRR